MSCVDNNLNLLGVRFKATLQVHVLYVNIRLTIGNNLCTVSVDSYVIRPLQYVAELFIILTLLWFKLRFIWHVFLFVFKIKSWNIVVDFESKIVPFHTDSMALGLWYTEGNPIIHYGHNKSNFVSYIKIIMALKLPCVRLIKISIN